MSAERFDIAIVGGGILGLATAAELSRKYDVKIVVLETEKRVAQHQTGHNSGVIHSGLYYKPGSLKANNCFEGRRRLLEFCDEHGIAYDICGKLVIATREDEIPRLEELERRGRANGLDGIERVDEAGIKEHEPHATGIDGLWVPETGIVDYVEVSEAYASVARAAGQQVRTGHRFEAVERLDSGLRVSSSQGEVECGYIVNCGGLQCDRVARLCGVVPDVRIVPFRGEYFELKEERRELVKGLIYPVPDPEFPFLGVHLTRGMDGAVEAGPNAVLALRREGYQRTSFSLTDTVSTLTFPGFWKMAAKNWKVGIQEMYRSGSRRLFAESLQRFVPGITADDLGEPGAGVRAQALDPSGKLVDDFHIVDAERMIHVLNAPSPGATASLAIGETIADKAMQSFNLD